MKSTFKKLLSLALSILMLFSMLSVGFSVQAEEEKTAVSIEVLNAKPLYETDGSYFWGTWEYPHPYFTYRVTYSDGSVESFCSNEYNEHVYYSSEQYATPWTVGGENPLTIYFDDVETVLNVEIIDCEDFMYVEGDGGVYITNSILTTNTVTIPTEINGKKVLGVKGLGKLSTSLVTLNIPDGIEMIGALNCTYLETINLGASVKNIQADAFNHCYFLTEINVAENNQAYSSVDGILYNKAVDTLVAYPLAADTNYTVPATVTNLDFLDSPDFSNIVITFEDPEKAFKVVDGVTYTYDMTKIISCDPEKTGDFVMPDSVTNVAMYAFEDSSLSSVTVSPNVTELVYGVFNNAALESITLPSSIESISYLAFSCNDFLEEVRISDIAAWCDIEFGSNPLSYAGDLYLNDQLVVDLVIPSNVKKINPDAFWGCTSIETVTLQEGVEEIGYNAFAYSGLTSLTLPNSLKKIGSYAFDGCELKSVNISSLENWCKIDFEDGGANPLSVSDALKVNGTPVTALTIPSSITDINDYAFYGAKFITSVKLHNSVKKIASSAFASTGITNVTIPDSVTALGDFVFAYSNLETVTIGKGVTVIPRSTFQGTQLTEISIPKNVSFIGNGAFAYSKLSKIETSGQSLSFGSYVFMGCPIESLNIGNTSVNFNDYALAETNATEISLPKSVTEITYGMFACSCDLATIDIPTTITKVGAHAFRSTAWYEAQAEGVVYLEHVLYNYKGEMAENSTINVKKGTTVIADSAFENQTNLKAVTLPSGLKTIGDSAFDGCENLKTIDIPASVEYIGELAFVRCYNLTAINVDPANKHYTSVDGVLYNKDMTELIVCPKQSDQSFTVPVSVEKILPFAFCISDAQDITILRSDVELMTNSLDKIHKTDEYDKNDRYFAPVITCGKNSNAQKYAEERTLKVNVDTSNGLKKIDGVWYKVENGSVDFNATTLVKHTDGIYYYVKNGVKCNDNTLVKYNGKWYHVNGGKWVKDTTLVKYNGVYYYVKNGVKCTDNTLVKYNGKWYHVNGGQWVKDTTLVKYNGVYYYVKNGVKTADTTLVKYNSKWYYVKNGVYTKETTLVKYTDGNYYYVKNGIKNTTDNTLCKYGSTYYHVKGGKWVKDTTLVKYNSKWHYVKNGKFDKTFNGKVKYAGKYYTVKNGIKV